jgi:hypothetical protein
MRICGLVCITLPAPGTLKTALAVIATLLIMAMTGAAQACAVKADRFSNDGSSAVNALRFDAKKGSSLEMHLGDGTDCYVSVDVDLPTRIAFSLTPVGAGGVNGPWEIRLTRRVMSSDDPVVLDTRVFAGSETQTFDLISGDYYFALRRPGAAPPSAAPRGARPAKAPVARPLAPATHRLVVASREQLPLPSLEPIADAARTVQLDRYSVSAVLGFNPGRRVELDLVLDMSQWPADRRDKLQIGLADMRGHAYRAEYARATPQGMRLYHYILTGQAYRLTVDKRQNQWPLEPLSDAEAAAALIVRVGAIRPNEVPPALANLAQWLSEFKLSDRFEVLELYDREKDAATAPDELRSRYDEVFKYVEEARSPGPRTKDVWEGGGKPRLLVRLRANGSREEISDIEEKFWKQGGISLWDRVLRKISMQTNIPGRQIVIDMPVYCSASLVFEGLPGRASRLGTECLMGSASVDLLQLGAGKLGLPGTGKVATDIVLPDAVEKFLPTFLPQPGSVEYLTKTAGYVELVVRGLRGHVIKGGSEWEKIQIMIVRSGSGEVRFITDGMLASGAGSYPPDTQFIKSIEAFNAEALSSYAKTLATAFRDYVKTMR